MSKNEKISWSFVSNQRDLNSFLFCLLSDPISFWTGNPRPTIQWYINNKLYTPTNFQVSDERNSQNSFSFSFLMSLRFLICCSVTFFTSQLLMFRGCKMGYYSSVTSVHLGYFSWRVWGLLFQTFRQKISNLSMFYGTGFRDCCLNLWTTILLWQNGVNVSVE